jgi:hypothetical protein
MPRPQCDTPLVYLAPWPAWRWNSMWKLDGNWNHLVHEWSCTKVIWWEVNYCKGRSIMHWLHELTHLQYSSPKELSQIWYLFIPKEASYLIQSIHPIENPIKSISILIFLWAENHFKVSGIGAVVQIDVVIRVGVGIGTSVCELFSSSRRNGSSAINVVATVAGSAR